MSVYKLLFFPMVCHITLSTLCFAKTDIENSLNTTKLLGYKYSETFDQYKIIDADTLEITADNQQIIKVRLTGIDAPEKSQQYAEESIQSLSQCLNHQPITIHWTEKDRYNRLLAKVISNDTDCNLQLIQQGYAWHYKYYQDQQPKLDQQQYADAERQAIQQKLGLWAAECVVDPWQWRNKKYNVCTVLSQRLINSK